MHDEVDLLNDSARTVGELRRAISAIPDDTQLCLGPMAHPGQYHDEAARGSNPSDELWVHLSDAHGAILCLGASNWWRA